jgi:serine/threonine protein kinase
VFAGRKTDPDHGKRLAKTAEKSASPAPSRYAEGDRFGAYVLESCIGAGQSARLYRAEHQGLKRRVALKVLLAGAGAAPADQERFLREARIAASIKHPNVVNVFDIGVHEGTPYLVMELLEGSDLARFTVERGRLDEATIMDIAVPIASALAAVHDAGMLHGDLKPANVFLSRGAYEQLEPRLLNFACSKARGQEPLLLPAAFGAACYTSPEVARGHAATPLSDQYAFGILLYECATGVNPFASAGNPGEVARRVAAGKFEPIWSHKVPLSRRLIAIIERAMHVDPAQRFPDVRALGRELLLLAGQRTRVTWGLSFSEIATSHPGKPAFLPVRAATSNARPVTWRRVAYAAAPVLVVVLSVVAWRYELQPTRSQRELASSSSEEVPGATPPQPSSPRGLDVVPSSAAPNLGERAARAAAAVEPPDSRGEAVPAPRTVAAPEATETSQAEPRVKTASAPRQKSSRVLTSKRVAKKSAPVADVEPDWLVKNASPSRAAPELTRGTNAAPILD